MIFRLALLLLLPTLAIANWQPLAPLPAGNGGFACGFIDGKLIVAGGTNWKDDTKHWLDSIWSYDPANNTWQAIGKLPQPCAYGASGLLDGRLIIAGGSNGQSAVTDIVAVDGRGQCTKVGILPTARVLCSSTVFENALWMAGGGTDAADLSTLTATTMKISVREDKASVLQIANMGDTGFGIGTAAGAAHQAFVFGGAKFNATTQATNLDSVFAFGRAAPIAKLPTAIRGITALSLSGAMIYLGGGFPSDDVGFTSDAWLFDGEKFTFTKAAPLPIAAMVHLVGDAEFVYCLGGEDKKKHRSDKMWRIELRALLPQTAK